MKKSHLIITLILMLVLCACGKENESTEDNNTENNSQVVTENETELLEGNSTEKIDSEIETEMDSTVTEEPEETEKESEIPDVPKVTYTYTELNKIMYVKSSVNVRDLPSTDGEKLGSLSKGQEVIITGQCNETGWYRISFDGKVAYVSKKYLIDTKPETQVTPTPPVQIAPEQTPEPIPTPEPEPTPDIEQPNTNNVFFNEANYVYDLNAVSIKPRYIYWEDGKLYAECFVTNGFDKPVYNITVNNLTFANMEVDIASAAFGGMQVTIQPYSYVVWTFVFGEDCITTPYADLSVLKCQSDTTYSY